VFTNVSAVPRGDAVNVLLVDSLNTLREDQNMVRDHLIAFLKTMQPGTPMAIFALETKLRLVQGFTGDSATLLAAVESKTTGTLVKTTTVSRTSQDKAQESRKRIVEATRASNALGRPPKRCRCWRVILRIFLGEKI
jgi:hypothetical protein